jgi:hypothetical protein
MKKDSGIGDKGPGPDAGGPGSGAPRAEVGTAAAAAAKGARDSGKIKFVGDGSEYIDGIPASDLTAQDYMALDEGQRAAVRASPLYEFDAFERIERPGEDEAAAASEEPAS